MKSLRIGERTIGPDHPVLVVAEIGVNHDGAIEQAIQLARIAGDCGADAVKFQVFRASAIMHTSCAPAEYQKHQCAGDDASSMLRRYELSANEMRELVAAIDEMEMLPLATPFSPDDVEMIAKLVKAQIAIAGDNVRRKPLLTR